MSREVAPSLNVEQTAPLVAEGVMYFHASATVPAFDTVTGEEIGRTNTRLHALSPVACTDGRLMRNSARRRLMPDASSRP